MFDEVKKLGFELSLLAPEYTVRNTRLTLLADADFSSYGWFCRNYLYVRGI